MRLSSEVISTPILEQVSNATDHPLTGSIETEVPDFDMPNDFGLGLILGPSGSGKSTILNAHCDVAESPEWDGALSIADHFGSYENARDRLGAVGLNSVPAWMRPYHTLSNGEQYRADLARVIGDGVAVDEFTSVVDRNVAKSCSVALSKWSQRNDVRGLVLATCHYDVAEWLQPDWVFDCAVGGFTDRRLLRRPEIGIELRPAQPEAWSFFSRHHYLSGDINKSARCWIALWEGLLVGFAAAIAYPSGTVKNAWRGHRTVVLPEFQGMGIGARISDAVGEIFISQGCRYFSKSANPNFGAYRNGSASWRPTSKNMKARHDYKAGRKTKEDGHKMAHAERVCFSHEYIGGA
jgi:GNAT superfamily N-acetyltransferase